MNKLKELSDLCKCEVSIEMNSHKNAYSTVEQYFKECVDRGYIEEGEIDSDDLAKMIELDFIVNIQFYPRTPVGSYQFYHYDIDEALDIAIAIAKRGY